MREDLLVLRALLPVVTQEWGMLPPEKKNLIGQ